jgi:NCAIR mutase (PurE)-related protein
LAPINSAGNTPMDQRGVRALLEQVASGRQSVEEALSALRTLPYEDLGFATLDHHRALRWGFPEVIFCSGKTPDQVAAIAARLAEHSPRLLGTRATAEQYAAARALVPDLQYHALARCLWLDREPQRPRHEGVVVVAAGTSDLPILEEAVLTLDLMGHCARRIQDVGVAGLHRLLPHVATFQAAHVVVVVAGMIAVPTSVGYGASFGGLAALLAMLNSCASGVAVVNIDNGYGAGHMAALINQRIVAQQSGESG